MPPPPSPPPAERRPSRERPRAAPDAERSRDPASTSSGSRGRTAPPTYPPRTPRPERRPSRAAKTLFGLVPGARIMAVDDARRGLPLVAMGLAVALAFALVAIGWNTRAHALERLRVRPALELVDGACLVLLALAYEGLRLASSLEERTRSPWAPRLVAAPFLPSVVVMALGPSFVRHWPQAVEAAWWTAIVLALGSTPALVWCTFEESLGARSQRTRLVWGSAGSLTAAVGATVAVLALVPGLAESAARAAAEAGFRLLPRLLGLLH